MVVTCLNCGFLGMAGSMKSVTHAVYSIHFIKIRFLFWGNLGGGFEPGKSGEKRK